MIQCTHVKTKMMNNGNKAPMPLTAGMSKAKQTWEELSIFDDMYLHIVHGGVEQVTQVV